MDMSLRRTKSKGSKVVRIIAYTYLVLSIGITVIAAILVLLNLSPKTTTPLTAIIPEPTMSIISPIAPEPTASSIISDSSSSNLGFIAIVIGLALLSLAINFLFFRFILIFAEILDNLQETADHTYNLEKILLNHLNDREPSRGSPAQRCNAQVFSKQDIIHQTDEDDDYDRFIEKVDDEIKNSRKR